VISPTPDLPAHNADHVSSTPIPNGVTSPIPVITTRLSKQDLLGQIKSGLIG